MSQLRDDIDFNIKICEIVEQHPLLYDYNRAEYSNRNVQDKIWEQIGKKLNATDILGVTDTVTYTEGDDLSAHDSELISSGLFRRKTRECKEKWKGIKSRYAKVYKANILPSGSASSTKKEYYLAPHLTFLNIFLKSRPPKGNLRPPPIEINDDSYAFSNEEHSVSQSILDATLPRTDSGNATLITESMQKKKPTLIDVNKCAYEYFASKKQKLNCCDTSEDLDLCFLKTLLPDMRAMTRTQKRKFKIAVISLAGQYLEENERENTSTSSFYRTLDRNDSPFNRPLSQQSHHSSIDALRMSPQTQINERSNSPFNRPLSQESHYSSIDAPQMSPQTQINERSNSPFNRPPQQSQYSSIDAPHMSPQTQINERSNSPFNRSPQQSQHSSIDAPHTSRQTQINESGDSPFNRPLSELTFYSPTVTPHLPYQSQINTREIYPNILQQDQTEQPIYHLLQSYSTVSSVSSQDPNNDLLNFY